MKIVRRVGVFETNSSSTHTLTLVSRKDYEADKSKDKPKYRRYGVLNNKKDKLFMACGCCKELFDDRYYESTSTRTLAYEATLGLIVRAYCALTGEGYDKTLAEVKSINSSGRACHMKFFYEGALDDAEYDYMLIDDMLDGDTDEVLDNIRHFFDDEFVLLYREYYGGVRWSDDDDE